MMNACGVRRAAAMTWDSIASCSVIDQTKYAADAFWSGHCKLIQSRPHNLCLLCRCVTVHNFCTYGKIHIHFHCIHHITAFRLCGYEEAQGFFWINELMLRFLTSLSHEKKHCISNVSAKVCYTIWSQRTVVWKGRIAKLGGNLCIVNKSWNECFWKGGGGYKWFHCWWLQKNDDCFQENLLMRLELEGVYDMNALNMNVAGLTQCSHIKYNNY